MLLQVLCDVNRPNHRAEWLFIAVLAMLCGVLTAVQYRWTGDLARMEAGQLTADFKQQALQIAKDFDTMLAEACDALVPSERDLHDLGVAKSHLAAWQQWQNSRPRPLFTRVAVAEVRGSSLVYEELDLHSGSLHSATWPADWKPLQQNLEGKLSRDFVPFEDPWGLVFEVPVFQNRREIEWVVFELDEHYVAKTWLPELFKERLTFEGQALGQLRVHATAEPDRIIFTSGTLDDNESTVRVRFNKLGRSVFESREFKPSRPGSGPPVGAWTLEASRTPAALEALVSASRMRNLGIAMLLTVLILTAGILLVRHTCKSRELAQRQMQFVAAVSHELRTPLTVIKGATHNLQHGVVSDPERVRRYLEAITQNTDNLSEMVEQVLAQAGAHRASSLRREPVNVGNMLREALTNCESETQSAGCVVETHIANDLPGVKGDATALRRVFQNLISNAARHAASGQWIGVEAATRDGVVEVTVSDKGSGIPAGEQRHVFEPFVRGAAAQEAQTRGSGLGLSLVKELVEAHDGSVSLRSEPGSGCIFTVKLPIA